MTTTRENTQAAPFPQDLADLVTELGYRPGWIVNLTEHDRGQGSKGLTLVVLTKGYDTYNPELGEAYRVYHYFPVPPAAYDKRSWMRWLLEQFLLIEQHECCEFFQIGESRPFAPNHGPGRDPYVIRELGTVEDAETTFRGERKQGSQS